MVRREISLAFPPCRQNRYHWGCTKEFLQTRRGSCLHTRGRLAKFPLVLFACQALSNVGAPLHAQPLQDATQDKQAIYGQTEGPTW